MNMETSDDRKLWSGWRRRLFEVIFEADTPAGRLFDVGLMIAIFSSVIVVMLDSIVSVRDQIGGILYWLEWVFTILFTIEYVLRLVCVLRPGRYAVSFFGIIDLLAVLPTYASLLLPGAHYSFIVVRLLRVLRVFRVLKLAHCLSEADMLVKALAASRRKIFVFIFTVVMLVVIVGSMMYVIEGQENGFTSIPRSVYWAVVTLTTVGYGDISPQTPVGQFLASIVMIMGYAIIAVPTGIVSVEFSRYDQKNITTQVCPECLHEEHDQDAKYCKKCGAKL